MERVETIAGLRAAVTAARHAGHRVGFVPTMGFLHEGHLRLVDEARRRVGCVVMSVFVNPTQFGPSEDFTRYPRDIEGDATKARERGVDLLFTPGTEEMYPAPQSIRVVADDLSARWEGEIRPGHFSGVLTVVAKLFNIVGADVAIFGRKDFQQATLVRRMVRELNIPVEVVVAPTAREPDGLAMSSRNAYLTTEERGQAVALVRALQAAAGAFAAGELRVAHLLEVASLSLADYPAVQPEYLAIVDPADMRPVDEATDSSVAIVAARLGRTRLIDNLILGEGA